MNYLIAVGIIAVAAYLLNKLAPSSPKREEGYWDYFK